MSRRSLPNSASAAGRAAIAAMDKTTMLAAFQPSFRYSRDPSAPRED